MRSTIIWVLFCTLFLTSCHIASTMSSPQVIVGNQTITVELAKTDQMRELGLMNRDHLDPNTGMLFIFPQEETMTFWMKNTIIPLDIMFINNERIIVSVATMTPCKADPCALYPSNSLALYALEVPAGFIATHAITVGETVRFVNI